MFVPSRWRTRGAGDRAEDGADEFVSTLSEPEPAPAPPREPRQRLAPTGNLPGPTG